MAKCLIPPGRKPALTAPSLSCPEATLDGRMLDATALPNRASGSADEHTTVPTLQSRIPATVKHFNPTTLPLEILQNFHFTFLIRHPRLSIPSLYKCSTPPMSSITGFHGFRSADAGYDELRRLFDYLRSVGHIGPGIAGEQKRNNGTGEADGGGETDGRVDICVVDADDLLNDPEGIVKAYCKSVGLRFEPDMLSWDTPEERQRAEAAFEKWAPFHDVALRSTCIMPRVRVSSYFGIPK